MSSRIAKLRKEAAERIKELQTFCLNPSSEKFQRLCNDKKIADDEDFPLWRLACLFQYGEQWGLTTDPLHPTHSIAAIETDFMNRDEALSYRALNEPSRSRSISVLHIYFALGELKHIDLFYQCMGHSGIPHSTRVELAEIYRNTKFLYRSEIARLKGIKSDHFKDYNMRDIDFTYFDTVKERALAEKARINEQNAMMTSLNNAASETLRVESVKGGGNKESKDPKEPKESLRIPTVFPTQIYGISNAPSDTKPKK